MLISRKINIALFCGIITAALIVSKVHVSQAVWLIAERTLHHMSDIDNLYLYTFLIAISSIITLLTNTGSAAACARIISQRVRTRRGAETSSIMLSFLMSIDDYLSILTVGFVMRSIADRLGVARTKLAFLVHSLSGSVVILVPISSWAAAIISNLDQAGVTLDPTQQSTIAANSFFVYLRTIPFMFYSIFIIASVLFIVRKKLSFGPLYSDEKKAATQPVRPTQAKKEITNNHSLIELLLPLGTLLGGVFIGILYTGGFFLLGGTNSFIDAFAYNDQTFFVMCITGCIALALSIIYALYKQMISLYDIPRTVFDGFCLMRDAILMVILASILGTFLQHDLMTGNYLAQLLLGSIPITLLPTMVFLTSLLTALATGSAWGTFALMLPITIQMLLAMLNIIPPANPYEINILFPVLGAIFAGAVCGDHISPFSETTIMTATSTGVTPLEHVRTQILYAVPAIISTAIGFLISGFLHTYPLWLNCIASIVSGISICFILLYYLNKAQLTHKSLS